MIVIKKIALKGLLLIIALVAMNFIYKATLWEADLERYSNLTAKINSANNADILYLGDCSDSYFGKEMGMKKA